MDQLTSSDDDTRWADAESLLDGAPTASAERRLRSYLIRMWCSVGGVVVLAVSVGVLFGVLFGLFADEEYADPGHGRRLLSVALNLVALVLLGIGLVRSARRTRDWRAPALVLARSQRKELLEQVRGRRPAHPSRIRLARDVAERQVIAGRQGWLYVGLALQLTGLVIGGAGRAFAAFATVAVLCFVVLLGGRLWPAARRARRFLTEHPPATVG